MARVGVMFVFIYPTNQQRLAVDAQLSAQYFDPTEPNITCFALNYLAFDVQQTHG